MFLKNAVVYNDVFEPVKADILTDGERIKAVAPMAEPSDETVYDLTGLTLEV